VTPPKRRQAPAVIPLVYEPDPELGRIRARVVASTWQGPVTLYELREGEPDPDAATLDSMAAAIIPWSGVRPVVRILQVAFGPPALTPQPLDAA
jgi:hypothetical protein